jgi:Tol biopolymer transport system component
VVYYSAGALWKVSIDGGEPVKVFESMPRSAVSPDGKLIAYSMRKPGSPDKLALFSIGSGSSVKVFDVKLEPPENIRWTPDGRAITYVSRENGTADIWSQPLDGGEPKKLTDFKANQIFSFDWSRENKLVISYGTNTSNIVMIRNMK